MADPLLQPFQLKHLTLRNRVISTSHEPAYSEEALPKERYRLYHEEKAKGGIAMTMIGGSSIVAPDSPQAFGNLYVGSDAIIPWFKELTAGVHKHGAAVMCQITHLGRRTSWAKENWLPVIAPSPVREPAHRAFPKEMEDWDFVRVIAAYGAAARRCREGGMDGIEIESYGHLFDAFWSPITNERTDAYGTQTLENRMRFSVEVLQEGATAIGWEKRNRVAGGTSTRHRPKVNNRTWAETPWPCSVLGRCWRRRPRSPWSTPVSARWLEPGRTRKREMRTGEDG